VERIKGKGATGNAEFGVNIEEQNKNKNYHGKTRKGTDSSGV